MLWVGIGPGGFEGLQGNRLLGCLRMPAARSWGEGGGEEGALRVREVLLLPTPLWLGSELPRRPLIPELHNFQGMSQISGSSGRHLKKERQKDHAPYFFFLIQIMRALPPAGSAHNCRWREKSLSSFLSSSGRSLDK